MLDFLAEQKLAEAVSRGALDNLPGAGRPLELDVDALVPEELRLAYRILKNAGYVPPEVEQLNDIAQLERLVCESNPDSSKAARKLALLKTRIESAYYDKVSRRLR